MQARTRRNRVAVLVSTILVFTTTGGVQIDRNSTQRSGAANTAYAAFDEDFVIVSDELAGTGADSGQSNPYQTGAEGYDTDENRKALLDEYDGSLDLVGYEAVNTEPDDPLTKEIAAITTTANSSEKSEVIDSTTTVTTVWETQPAPLETIAAEPDSVVFYTCGYGHGVGMSQNGANFYATYDGWTYDQILALYYPGTQLVQTGASEWDLMTVDGKTDTVVSILSQICYNEMGSSFDPEAIKAQAVAAYSFYLYNGYGAGMICKADPPQNVIDAVRSVLGLALYYNNAPALTSFYASSGGATADCRDIFLSEIPYLVSVPVRYDESCDPHFNSTKVFSTSTLKYKLETAYNITLTGNPYDWIQLEYGEGGYVATALIGGQVRVRGNELRGVLGLKSPKFEFVCSDDFGTAPAPGLTTEPAVYADPSVTHASISYLNAASTNTTTETTATEVNASDTGTDSSTESVTE